LKKILFILLLLPFVGLGQAGYLRYHSNTGMVVLKGSTEADTMTHITSDKLLDHFGKVRFRDTARLDARINYQTNLHGSFTAYSLIDKAYLDSVLSALGGGGITSINSQTGPAITLDEGTSGTDFSITQSTNTIFFNLPSSSASNRGLVTAADWSTFNSKLSNITGLVSQGTNVTITGTGTSGDPYVVNSSGGGGGGDFSSNTATSVDNELLLFSGTGGKTGKRATSTGILLGTSGVLSATTTSAGISGVLSDETGTGVAVFGTAPTLTAATMAGHLTNNSTGAYDIGATGVRFRYIFANGLNINSSGAGAANTINVIPGFTITNGTTPSGGNTIMTLSSAAASHSSNTVNFLNIGNFGINTTSTGSTNILRFSSTINSTSTAPIRAIWLDLTNTASVDLRAIETMAGQIRFNGLTTATTPDSVIAYEDGYLRPTTSLNMPGAVISRTSTTTATSGTGETDLYTFTTPANTLNADNEFLEYFVSGVVNPSSVNDGGNITIRIYWAGTEVLETTSLSAVALAYTVRVTVIRTSSSNARVTAEVYGGSFPVVGGLSPSVTDVTTTFSNTNIIKVTGQASDADQGMNVTTGNLKRWR
jgi:hypothetical protein